MSLEEELTKIKQELDNTQLPNDMELDRLLDKNMSDNVSPMFANMVASLTNELSKKDSPLTQLLVEFFTGFDSDKSKQKAKSKVKPKTSSAEDSYENARQTYEWLSTTFPFEQIMNLIKAAMFFAAMSFGEMNSAREKANQEANRINRPNISDLNTIREQWFREPEHRNTLKQIMTLHGLTDQAIDAFFRMAEAVPTIQDMVMFALRETYDANIVNSYGLGQDMPSEFLKDASRNGLSEKDAKMYWFAHWRPPSIQQANEMLHRGAITPDEHKTLYRINDVMPKFREPLKKITYALLTRVDIRRIYSVGLLSPEDVYKAYTDLGYEPHNAKFLTDFTVQEFSGERRDFTQSQIFKLLNEKLISDQEALQFLIDIGYNEDKASLLLDKHIIDEQEKVTKKVLNSIKRGFIRGTISEQNTRTQLAQLQVTLAKIDELIDSWSIDKANRSRPFSTKEIQLLVEMKLLSHIEALFELSALGYPEYRAKLLIKLWE